MASKKPIYPIVPGAVIPALAIFVGCFLLLYHTPLEIFPKNNTFFGYTAESDGNFEGGNSSVSVDTTGKHLTFAYTLGDSSEMPFARLVFHAHQLFRTLNLNHYRTIEIDLHPEETNSFVLTIFTYIPGFSDPDDSQTHRPYSQICHPVKGQKRYRYKLRDFATPSAWFSAVNSSIEDAPHSDWAQMTHLSISDATLETGVPLKITIEKIRFVNSIPLAIAQSLIIPLLYLIGFAAVSRYMRLKRNRAIKQRLYHPDSRESYTPEDKIVLLDFLAKNYADPLLTLEKIEKQTNLNQFQVSEIIADTFKMRYKQYINHVRLEEAKKLLVETDAPINAIAEKVGYCYSNSFSRAFRLSEGVTPNEYRKEKQENLRS